MSSIQETQENYGSFLTNVAQVRDVVMTAAASTLVNTSLIDIAKPSRIEPIVMLSKDCKTLEITDDLLMCLLNIYSAYYMQAVSQLTTVGAVKTKKVLDKLNPNRDWRSLALEEETFALYNDIKNYKFKLPTTSNKESLETFSLEGFDSEYLKKVEDDNDDLTKDNKKLQQELDSFKKDNLKTKDVSKLLSEPSNFNVGKVLDVIIKVNNTEITMPVVVKMSPSYLEKPAMVRMLTARTTQKATLTERYHSFREGSISLFKDAFLCLDILKEHRKNLIEDKTGLYSEIMSRNTTNKLLGLLSMSPSLNTASNIIIITDQVAKEIEYQIGAKLSNYKAREKLFESIYGMILVVLDTDAEMAEFYYNGISTSSTTSFRSLKSINKNGKGPDITDILKDLNKRSSPVF